MNVSTTVRLAALSAVAAFAVACGDSPVAPGADPLLGELAPALSVSGEQQATITIDPTVSKSYYFGYHRVHIPAGAVCADGGYGPSVWDLDCTPASGPTTIAVTYTDGAKPAVKFGTDVRFRPTAGWVVLHLKVHGSLDTQLKYAILYTPTGTTLRIDESLTDSSLRAWRSPGNVISRRLKHFSGYNVSLGMYDESCADSNYDGVCDDGSTAVQ